MQEKKVLTLAALIDQADQLNKTKQKNQTKDLEIEGLGVIRIRKPDRVMLEEAELSGTGSDGDKMLLFNCIVEPNLKDSALQKAYNCVEPTDILDALFEPGEITQIARHCIRMAGFGDTVKDLKNA